MLVFTRRIGETIRISDNIYCTVLGLKGNQVRLGFSAPEEVHIHREEIYLKIQTEKEKLKSQPEGDMPMYALVETLVAELKLQLLDSIKQFSHQLSLKKIA
jgi:carbon storage regulator